MLENTPEFWNSSWHNHMSNYLSTAPRTGIFVKQVLNKKIASVLEIACGSSRDSMFLSNENYCVTATDFGEITIKSLNKKFSLKNMTYLVADAFKLPFEKNSFDIVFHNGFFVLFSENEKILQLLKEQERVSQKFILILVHNKVNSRLNKQFIEQSKNDSLYDVRFFYQEELKHILILSKIKYKTVHFLKFGGFADILNNKILFGVFPNIAYPLREILIPLLYQYQKWENTERIACLIELNK